MNLLRRSIAGTSSQGLTGRTRELLSQLNLHYAGVALLALVNLYLLVHIGFTWREASSQDADALAAQRVSLKTAEIAARPLQGLDAKLAAAHDDADSFYRRRLPVSYSEVAAELGVLSKRTTVKLNGVQYAQAPVLGSEDGALTEVRMDASLSGEYRGLVEFINGLERDRQFFLVSGITLTGAQSGAVNLRMRLTTYLRAPATPDELRRASLAPVTEAAVAGNASPDAAPSPAPTPAHTKTGGAR
jgi:hypothetical protein